MLLQAKYSKKSDILISGQKAASLEFTPPEAELVQFLASDLHVSVRQYLSIQAGRLGRSGKVRPRLSIRYSIQLVTICVACGTYVAYATCDVCTASREVTTSRNCVQRYVYNYQIVVHLHGYI